MRKSFVGLFCVLIAIIIAVSMVGCGKGPEELTFSTDPQQPSSGSTLSTSDPSSENDANPETVVYQLTTRQGETVQVLSTTVPSTEIPTMNYDPVSVPAMETTMYGTTAYQPPTYSGNESNPVTTKPVTTEGTTEKKIKYVSVYGFASVGDGKIAVDTQISSGDEFGEKFGKLEAKKGSVVINYGEDSMKANCDVLTELVGGEARISIDMPQRIRDVLDSGELYTMSIDIPEGLIVGSKNVANKKFCVTMTNDPGNS